MLRNAALVLISLLLTQSALAAEPATKPAPRAARSVHLTYSVGQLSTSEAFYNECTVQQSVPGSYFMACGFKRGYFGIQEQANGRKVVIFSVWDPAKGDNPKAVPLEQRVEVPFQGEGVEVKRFGGEGTGGQSFFPYDWKIGETCRFFVRVTVDGEKTAYAAYFWLADKKAWKHLATFRTRTGGEYLTGLYSFVEDFRRDTKSALQTRRASFGNTWALAQNEWRPLLRARFTASSATWEAQESIDAGVANGRFYLQTGGDTKMSHKLSATLERPAGDAHPPEMPQDEKSGKK